MTPGGHATPGRRHVVFELGGVEHAVPAHQVRHSLPGHEEVGREVRFLGQAYPVVTLRTLFRLSGPAASGRLVLLVETDRLRMALVVDRLVDLVFLDETAVVPLPLVFTGEERRWFAGLARLGPRILVVLRIDGLLEARPPTVAADPPTVTAVR